MFIVIRLVSYPIIADAFCKHCGTETADPHGLWEAGAHCTYTPMFIVIRLVSYPIIADAFCKHQQ